MIADLSEDAQHIIIETEYTEKDLVKQVPGVRWDAKLKVWKARKSWATGCQLRGVFGDKLNVNDRLATWLWEEYNTRVDIANARRELTNYEGDSNLRPFQRAGVAFLGVANGALLADEMGTGKTVQALAWMSEMNFALPGIVISPNTVKASWDEHVPKWCPNATPYVVTGGAVGRRKILEAASEDASAIVIINYEALRLHSRLAPYGSVRLARCSECGGLDESLPASRCEVHLRELNRLNHRSLIIDEAHRIKDPRAKWTRATWALSHAESVVNRLALTGTPIANNIVDLWSILHAIAPHEFPTRSSFIDRYALMTWNAFGGMDVSGIRPDTRDELLKIINPRMRRMMKSVVLPQLPPKVYVTRRVQLEPKQRKAYNELAKECVTRLDDGTLVIAGNGLVRGTRLLQLSSAYCITNEAGEIRLSNPSPKLDELERIIDDSGSSSIAVCAESRQLIELAALRLEKLKIPFVQITGAVNEHERRRALDLFQTRHVQVMLFTVKAGGVGLTMTAADTLVFLQRSWSLIDNMQAEDRVHRIGSEHHRSVTIIDVIADDTVEEAQLAALMGKYALLQEVTRDREALIAMGRGDDVAALDARYNEILGSNLYTQGPVTIDA